MCKQGGSRKERIRGTMNLNIRKSSIHQMKPHALRRINIRYLTRASVPTIRKETIERKVV